MEDQIQSAGNYYHTLDAKGRLIIPAKIREILGEEIYIGRGAGGCLYVFNREGVEAHVKKFEHLPIESDMKAKSIYRYYVQNIQSYTMDKQGRICLPPHVRKYSGLEKDVVLVTSAKNIELWDRDKWEELNNIPFDELLPGGEAELANYLI